MARDLKERFQIGRFIFVGDRGMVSRKIIEFPEKEEIDYVVALRRRQCLESARAIEVEVGPKQITFITPPNPRNLGILKALGLRLPKVLVE